MRTRRQLLVHINHDAREIKNEQNNGSYILSPGDTLIVEVRIGI